MMPARLHIRASALALGLATALPALAGDGAMHEHSHGRYLDALLNQVVRDTEIPARATVRYFDDVMTGGSEMVIGDDGEEYELLWDGWKSVFEVDFTIAPGTEPADPNAWVREAIAAVCPSVDQGALAAEPVDQPYTGLYQVDLACPEADR